MEQALRLAETFDLPETLSEALTSKAVLIMCEDRLFEARVLLGGAESKRRRKRTYLYERRRRPESVMPAGIPTLAAGS